MLLELLQYLTIIQSLLFAGALLFSFEQKKQRFLGYFFLIMGLLCLTNLKSGFVEQQFNSNDSDAISLFVVFFVQFALLNHFAGLLQLRFKRIKNFLFVPLFIGGGYLITTLRFNSYADEYLGIWVFTITLIELTLLTYLLVKLHQRIRQLDETAIANEVYMLYWSKWLLYGRLFRIAVLPLIMFVPHVFGISLEQIGNEFIPPFGYSFQLLLFSILYYLAYQNALFFHASTQQEVPMESIEQRLLEVVIPDKHKPSVLNKALILTEEQVSNYTHKLSEAMTSEVFTRPNLILKELALELNIPINHLSHLINTTYGVNFNEYINKHRVDYAKTLMLADITQKKTIYAIAKESGFNSEKPFYSAFKQFTGLTPKQFRMEQQEKTLNFTH